MNIVEQTLGQLARDIPGATAIFHRYLLDFCCGGERTLSETCRRKQLDAGVIAAELEGLYQQAGKSDHWQEMKNGELVDHILSRYHYVHRQQLPELIRLSGRVELVHGGHPECPLGLTDTLERLQMELIFHMQKEEQILFPMIARGIAAMAVGPVTMMRAEHDDHVEALAELQRITRNLTLPDGACNTWAALYSGLETLVQDLMDHIHLENNILFQRIDGRGVAAHG